MKQKRMKIEKKLTCYIAVDNKAENNKPNDLIDGLYCFSIPNYGIQYRSRTFGNLISLEFSAFFSLLEFINSKLEKQHIHKIHIYSSMPQFIFSFAKNNSYLKPGSYYRKLLEKYNRKFEISVGYLKSYENKALHPASGYPSLPQGQAINLGMDKRELRSLDFKPFGFDQKF